MTKKAERAAAIEANKRAAWNKGLSILTGHIFARRDHAAASAAYEAGTSYADYAAALAAKEPVGDALHPRKADAIECAAQEAQARIDRMLAKLEADGWDLDITAPYPNSLRDGRETYLAKQAKRNAFSSITKEDPARRNNSMRGPHFRVRSEEGIARYIDNAKQDAAFQYDAFICKMAAKIGEGAHAASIEGNHIWGNSILTVEMLDGTDQIWHTQQIWNTSKLGKTFPQWPSRRAK